MFGDPKSHMLKTNPPSVMVLRGGAFVRRFGLEEVWMRYGDGASVMGLEALEEEKERSDCVGKRGD